MNVTVKRIKYMSIEQVKEQVKERVVENTTIKEIMSKADLVNALQSDFATSVTKVYINSLKEEKSFREITVKE